MKSLTGVRHLLNKKISGKEKLWRPELVMS